MTKEIGMVLPSKNIFRNTFNYVGILLYYYYGLYHNKSDF